MALIDMKRSKADKAAAEKQIRVVPQAGEDYPYGLHIELDHPTMNKLGMNETPSPGDEMTGQFKGRVIEAREDQTEGEEPRRHARVLLHHLSVDQPKTKGADKRAGLRDTIAKSVAKYEDSAADRRADKKEAKARGESVKQYENSPADRRADKREAAAARK